MGWVSQAGSEPLSQRIRRRLDRRDLLAALEELETGRTRWKAEHRDVLRELERLAEVLAAVRHQVEIAATMAGAPIPPLDQVVAAESRLDSLRGLLEGMAPDEAAQRMAGLQSDLVRLAAVAKRYQRDAVAVIRAERHVARLRKQSVCSGSERAKGALREAEALLPCLRSALVAGQLETFREQHHRVRHLLAEARQSLRR